MKDIIRTPETHPLTWRLRDDKQPVWLDEYRSKNGYEGARKALTGLSPDEIVNQVKDAGLKGRGGAGFSTGLKWSLMPKDESMNIRYLLCNADEMEPGTVTHGAADTGQVVTVNPFRGLNHLERFLSRQPRPR